MPLTLVTGIIRLGGFLAEYGHGGYSLRRVLMAATVVAIFRHEVDLERPISHVGFEGTMMVIRVHASDPSPQKRIDVFVMMTI